MSRRVRAKIFATALSVLVLPLLGLIATAQATVILYDFNGTGTGGPTVHASMGLNAASTTSNHMLTLADVTSFAVQITTGSFTASGSALPGSLSGQWFLFPQQYGCSAAASWVSSDWHGEGCMHREGCKRSQHPSSSWTRARA